MLPLKLTNVFAHSILLCFLLSATLVCASENEEDQSFERCENWNSAKTFLASRQCKAWAKLGVNLAYVRDQDSTAWEELKATADPQYIQQCKDLFGMYSPTRWEMRVTYCVLLHRAKVVDQIIFDTLAMDFDPTPVFGTVPAMQTNGFAASIPTGETVMVIDSSLLTYSLLLSKVAALSWSSDQETMIDDSKRRELEYAAGRRFRDLLWSYSTKGRPSAAKRYQLPAQFEERANALLSSIEYFIVAHEYGHLIGDKSRGPGEPIPFEGSVSSAIVREHLEHLAGFGNQGRIQSHLNELTADLHGISVSNLALQKEGRGLSTALAGPTVYFVANDMVCRMLGLLHSGQEGRYPTNATHPPPMVRLAHLRSIVSDYFGEKSAPALNYSQQIELVLESHWKKYRLGLDGLAHLIEDAIDNPPNGQMPPNTRPYGVEPASPLHRLAEQCSQN